MSLINCEIHLLTWSNKCFIIDDPIASQKPTFTITDTKLYFRFATFSTQDNAKLLEQLTSGFKRTIKSRARSKSSATKPIFRFLN